jgi:hypothetical protein
MPVKCLPGAVIDDVELPPALFIFGDIIAFIPAALFFFLEKQRMESVEPD